jgi:hypothetical protein
MVGRKKLRGFEKKERSFVWFITRAKSGGGCASVLWIVLSG